MAVASARKVAAPVLSLPRSGVKITAEEVLADYRLAFRSRVASVIGRREVLSGRAKFGIFGDGKEVPNLAMARAFREGDWRCGYYRDQTFMLAAGMATIQQLFAQLYASASVTEEPQSGGRGMNAHFATRVLDAEGNFTDLTRSKNTAADLSPLAGWMPVSLGLAYASKLFRVSEVLGPVQQGLSNRGQEIVFSTIGDAATSEGPFWESINAAAVLQVPLMVCVWDDGYGISVPVHLQTAKGSISDALAGMRPDERPGLTVEKVNGWDYIAACDAFQAVSAGVREGHAPALLHVVELTQPQGHSTSGSHERYKSPERLAWEADHDCLARLRRLVLETGIAAEEQLVAWEKEDRAGVEADRQAAWDAFQAPIEAERDELLAVLDEVEAGEAGEIDAVKYQLTSVAEVNRKLIQTAGFHALLSLRDQPEQQRARLAEFLHEHHDATADLYQSQLYSQGPDSPLRVEVEPPDYSDNAASIDGRMVLLRCFDANLERDPRIFVLGEDVGKLGDVNLVFEGLNQKHGDWRLTDTGIREATIVGQAIGAAMRGLRPIADIQYVDYLPYALQLISDYLANLRWRTAGGQKAPVIIRTKGHRLVGIWHAGSPMGTILHATRGLHVLVPRNMVQAAGFYNTLLRGDDPAIVIETLNGYRLKERPPANVGTFTLPLGRPEVLRSGADLTLLTYGACCALALDAAVVLKDLGVEVEVIDAQSLNPFDIEGVVGESVRRTAALLVVDEDVPGGASAYMLSDVLQRQGAWAYLDAEPRTLTASPTRPAYGTDGEYFTKPSREDIVRAAYSVVRERDPGRYPALF